MDERRSGGEKDFFSREGRPFRRASVVWGGEAKKGSTPPTRGLRVREREREGETKEE